MPKTSRFVSMLLILGFGAFFVGCKKNTESGKKNVSATNYDIEHMKFNNVKIVIASRYGSDVPDEVYFRRKIKEFNDADNGITVAMDNITTESDYLDHLRTSFATGDTPNVFLEYGGSRIKDYLEAHALLDMTPYFSQYPEWKKSFNPSVWDKLEYQGYNGIWGVPFKMYVITLFYNKEIFSEQGLTPPKTFDELLSVCAKLKKAGIVPFQVGEKDNFRLGHFSNNLIIKSLGTAVVEKLADRTLTYDSPEIIGTFSIIKDMLDKNYLGDNILSTTYSMEKSVFASSKCAMRWDGSWYVSEIFGTPIYNKTGVVPFPSINPEYEKQGQGGASDMWFISTAGKTPEEIVASVKLLKYLTSAEYTAGCNEVAAAIFPIKFTPTATTPDNPLLRNVQTIADSMTAMSDDIQNYDPDSHMLDTVRAALQGLAMGNTPEQCAKQIVDRIKDTQ